MVGVIGLSHKTAPVELRERFSFTENEIIDFFELVKGDKKLEGIMVLSTCNRTEIYYKMTAICQFGSAKFITDKLVEFKKYKGDIKPYTYMKHSIGAVRHLFKVASGIESMVIGEYEIVSQIKNAYSISRDKGVIGKVLDRLVTKSLEASKNVRTETAISDGAVSVSYAAVEQAGQIFKNLQEREIFLIGTGETGGLVLKNLAKKGCKNISLSNRTQEKAMSLSKSYNASVISYNDLASQIIKSDVVICSTAAQKSIISKDLISEIMTTRNNKELLLIDLGVPRNIDETVKDIRNIKLINVDNLEAVLKNNTEKRQKEVLKSKDIIDSVVSEFMEWKSTLILSPAIHSINNNFHEVNKAELEGYTKKRSKETQELMEEYGVHITKKYARMLIKRLKEVTDNGKKENYVKVINELFDLH